MMHFQGAAECLRAAFVNVWRPRAQFLHLTRLFSNIVRKEQVPKVFFFLFYLVQSVGINGKQLKKKSQTVFCQVQFHQNNHPILHSWVLFVLCFPLHCSQFFNSKHRFLNFSQLPMHFWNFLFFFFPCCLKIQKIMNYIWIYMHPLQWWNDWNQDFLMTILHSDTLRA